MTTYTTATEVVESATPASQLGIAAQCRPYRAAAAQPRKGAKKLMKPMAPASLHLARKMTGSSSAPARNVRMIAPVPERNFTQVASAPSTLVPMAAPRINWAMVPTMISDMAVATRNQIENNEVTRANPSHSAASVQISVISYLASHAVYIARTRGRQQKTCHTAGCTILSYRCSCVHDRSHQP